MSRLYTGLAGRLSLLWAIVLLLAGFPALMGQVSECCPHQIHGVYNYENPLNENWLSAYDVKAYDLALSVSNENTFIEGSTFILVEATRQVDTLVFELQDNLTVSEVVSDNTQLEFEHID